VATQRIRRFSPVQTAKVMAVLYALVALVFVPFIVAYVLMSPNTAGFGIGFAIAIPVVYAIIGFVMVLIAAALYNLVAGWVGGIEVEME
jgi:hypothetical protein